MKIVYFLASFLVLASLVASDCPGDCSGHGDCVRNVCHCTGNWDGSDCSLYNQYLNSGEVHPSFSHYKSSSISHYKKKDFTDYRRARAMEILSTHSWNSWLCSSVVGEPNLSRPRL